MKKYVQILCSTDVWYILIKKVDMNDCRGQISVKVLHLHLAVSLSHFILSCMLYCESTRNSYSTWSGSYKHTFSFTLDRVLKFFEAISVAFTTLFVISVIVLSA